MSSANTGLSFTARLAHWSAVHRWIILLATVIVIVLAVFSIIAVGTETRDDDSGVGESGKGSALLNERFAADPSATQPARRTRREGVIFSNPSLDANDPRFVETVESAMQSFRDLPQVIAAVSYFDTQDASMFADDGNAVLASVTLQNPEDPAGRIDIEPFVDTVRQASNQAVGFEIGVVSFRILDDELDEILTEDFNRILIYSLVIGLVILVLAFRALVAAVIPLAMAVGSIFTAIGIAALVSQVYPLVELYAEMILLMGLAVGIDYSLFIVSRFRTERSAGRDKIEAITVAANTTGRAVFYAGITVILSLAGLMLTRDFTFISLAAGAIIVVFVAVIASLTLLPSLLSLLGDSVNRLRIPILGRESDQGGIWSTITGWVMARPVPLASLTVAGLVALTIPFFSMNLGFNAGADALPDALEGKRALELLEDHFSSSLIVPAKVIVDAPDVNTPEIRAALAALIETVGNNDAFLGPFDTATDRAGTVTRINVPLAGNIDDDQSEDAVRLLREQIVPEAFAGLNVQFFVAGDTAEGIDFRDRMFSSAYYVFAFVLGLSFLLLLVMFRSIVIPIKALVLNLLSVGAVYGVLVMVFQWGWGISILGSEETGIIETWLPLFLFGILFGLSMDYHMLLLNRIKEEYDKHGQNELAVATGIRLTAGQITSAASVMVGVFAAFATSRILGLQQFGLGLAVAVLIDATVIRVILLPASMKLLGRWNWYLPGWLEWLPQVTPVDKSPSPVPAPGND
ncbi:MAG: MMPL family transporter [SAR202 cluster bacterium]|nr:MMPL family transporter [SAR202 cluster bacterium]MQG79359.1 MMPL family transporter [SAR202 cluster bacterium]|tara:strand:- start:111 stop:2351 length:2241 start_codon:yes stop_codon:yes gene_type:complete